MDEGKLHQFIGQMLNDLGGAVSISLVQMGDALGLYKALHKKGPMTTQETCRRSGGKRAVSEGMGISSCRIQLPFL